MAFIQQVLNNEKLYKRRMEIRQDRVILWPELAIAKIWEQAIVHPDFLRYMPDNWTGAKKTERDFFWAILVTL